MIMRRYVLALSGALLIGAGCGDGGGISFFGRVYDGVTGQRVTGYEIKLQFAGSEIFGGEQGDGRFALGPLPFYHDYTIAVSANGYRPFLSHNAMPINSVNDDTTFDAAGHSRAYYYDVVLFPESAQAPGVVFDVTYAELEELASGTIRLWPTHAATGGASSLINDYLTAVADGHLSDQRWDNDEDLQQAIVQKDFSGGSVEFAAGELIFGVTYNVHIFNLNRHRPVEGTFVAGYEFDKTFVAQPLGDDPLQVVYRNDSEGSIVPDGRLVIVFNQPIEFDELTDVSDYAEAIDSGITVAPLDGDLDGVFNRLNTEVVTNSPDVLENQTSMQIVDGIKLVFSWNQNGGMNTQDANDPIRTLTWNALDQVQIRPANGNAATATNVGALLSGDPGAPTTSVTIQLRINNVTGP